MATDFSLGEGEKVSFSMWMSGEQRSLMAQVLFSEGVWELHEFRTDKGWNSGFSQKWCADLGSKVVSTWIIKRKNEQTLEIHSSKCLVLLMKIREENSLLTHRAEQQKPTGTRSLMTPIPILSRNMDFLPQKLNFPFGWVVPQGGTLSFSFGSPLPFIPSSFISRSYLSYVLVSPI